MANYKKAAIAIGVLLAAGSAAAFTAVSIGKMDDGPETIEAFGISSEDMVFPYMRQAAWAEVYPGRYRIAPPQPDPAFAHYEISSDPDTDRVCAVYTATTDDAARDRLKTQLTQSYGEPTVTASYGSHWSTGAGYVELEDIDTLYQFIWDMTGTCYKKNKPSEPTDAGA